MRRHHAAALGLMLLPCLAAQDKPYDQGDVDAFLQRARSAGKPAIVLFNFDDKSG